MSYFSTRDGRGVTTMKNHDDIRPQGYRYNTRLAGDVRNPDRPDYVISADEYRAILERKRRGLGQWDDGPAARRQLRQSA